MKLQIVPAFAPQDGCITTGCFHACHSAAFRSHVFWPEYISYARCSSLLALVQSS